MEKNNCKEPRWMRESGLKNKAGRKKLFSPPYFQGGVDAQRTGWFRPGFGVHTRSAGFTLIELLATIVILAILTATVSMRWGATDSTISYQADLLARNLRHVQMLAMTWGQALRVAGAGASYSVVCVTAGATPPCNVSPVIDPATGAAFSVALSNNVTVSATTVDIDSLGRPLSAGVLLTTARIFTLSGAGQTWSITVTPITGFVSVSSP